MNGYTLLDYGYEKRFEQWGQYRLVRPDPTAYDIPRDEEAWKSVDASYEGEKGKGEWVKRTDLPEHWNVDFDDLQLIARLAPYKHTGIFPEQAENWRWMRETAKKSGRSLNILNLFAYTGGATIALAKDGHFVTHVDSSKPSIGWAKENAVLNSIAEDRIRWMLEDAAKFTARELKRGKKYDAIILDPPAYGHSPTGKTWRVERDLKPLLEDCAMLLSDAPVFILLNGYAVNDTPDSFRRLLSAILLTKRTDLQPSAESAELYLNSSEGRQLTTGIRTRVTFQN